MESNLCRAFRRSSFEPDFGTKITSKSPENLQKSTKHERKSLQNYISRPTWVDLGRYGLDFLLLRSTWLALWGPWDVPRGLLGSLGELLGPQKSPKSTPKHPKVAKIEPQKTPKIDLEADVGRTDSRLFVFEFATKIDPRIGRAFRSKDSPKLSSVNIATSRFTR